MLSIIGLFGFAMVIVFMTTAEPEPEDNIASEAAEREATTTEDLVYRDTPSRFADDTYDPLLKSKENAFYSNKANAADNTGPDATSGPEPETFVIDLAMGAQVSDYDPQDDLIEVIYDPSNGLPELTTRADANGVSLLADGSVVAHFKGVTGFDLNRVVLIQS